MPHLGENSFFWQMPKGLSEEEREYYKVNATEMCDIFGALFTDGVTAEHILENDKQMDKDVIGSSLAVIPGDGLNIVISIGSAMVNKHLYIATLPIQIPVTVGTNDVLLRCDTTTEKPFVTAIVRKRTSTELTDNVNRTANVHEVPIATVTIPTGSQTVSETMIVDQRLNTNLASDGKPFCGLMKPRPNADTKGIWEDWTRLQAEIINKWKTFEEKAKQEWEEQKQGFNQSFETLIKDFDNQILNNQKTFEEWFDNLQTYLDGDVAANLAGEITKLKIEKADKKYVDDKISEIDVSIYEQKTYSELKLLKENKQLKIGQKYLLTDYVTKYQQPVSLTMKVGKYDLATATPSQIQEETEPLLLQAISKSEFAVECYSFKYPEDIIYYDFNDNICEDGSTPRNGFILRRYWVKNEVNVPNDWRHIKWARFKVDTTSIPVWTSGAVEKGKYYIVENNIVKSTGAGIPTSATDNSYFGCVVVWDYTNNFFLYDNSYGLIADKSHKKEYGTFSDVDGNIVFYCNNISIGGEYIGVNNRKLLNTIFKDLANDRFILNITAESGFESNTISPKCNANTFGSGCSGNTLNSSCHSNTFGSNCSSNTFGSSCHSNAFGSKCNSNTFGSSCNSNTFGSSCNSNTFSYDCTSNTFGSNCFNNMFGNSCDYNTIFKCYNNTFGNGFSSLFIKALDTKNVSNISDIQSRNYTITIELMSNGQYCYWYKTGTSSSNITTVVIP